MVSVATLSWLVSVDQKRVIRLEPIVDGVRLSSYFQNGHNGWSKTSGLALGVWDSLRWPGGMPNGRLRLLSCDCGAYDCRVSAAVSIVGDRVVWSELVDSRNPGSEIEELEFDRRQYLDSIDSTSRRLRRVIPGYVWWVVVSYRTDNWVFDWVSSLVAPCSFLLFFVAQLWFPMLAFFFLVTFVLDFLVWQVAERFFGYASPWLEPPHSSEGRCKHLIWNSSHLPRNWIKSAWIAEGSRLWRIDSDGVGEKEV